MTTEHFNQEFENNRGQMKSYLLRITASVADAEDIVQDTYIRGKEKLDTFKGQSSLKTWLFSIASNLAKDNIRARRRWVENVTDMGIEERVGRGPMWEQSQGPRHDRESSRGADKKEQQRGRD